MKLSEDVKQKIIEECDKWKDFYGDKTMEERKKMGMFFTPPQLTIDMIECLESIDPNEDYLDPAAGSGNILAALMIAGVQPEHIYVNELDPDMLLIAKKRLNELAMKLYNEAIPDSHFRNCDATTEDAYFVKEKSFTEKFGRIE